MDSLLCTRTMLIFDSQFLTDRVSYESFVESHYKRLCTFPINNQVFMNPKLLIMDLLLTANPTKGYTFLKFIMTFDSFKSRRVLVIIVLVPSCIMKFC